MSLSDGTTSYLEFTAKLHNNGSTTGEMMFNGSIGSQQQDLDGTDAASAEIGPKSAPGSKFYFRAAFDCMVVKGDRAVMSGTVSESNNERYIGQRVLLVVQDKGDDIKSPSTDKLTWGLYNPKLRGWVPSDAEVDDDKGAGITWLATDAERDDDLGQRSDKSGSIGCQSFPINSFSLVKVKTGDGNIEVRSLELNQPK